MKYSHLLMVCSVMFFVFSCVFSLSPQDLALAKEQNLTILSYLANHFHTPIIAYAAPLIAFVAISKSFLGHYLGAKEGLGGMVIKAMQPSGKTIQHSRLQFIIKIFIILTCWFTATVNPNILKMIEVMGGPVIAILLFMMPMYAMIKVPALKQYSNQISNCFITIIGIICISAIIYGLL